MENGEKMITISVDEYFELRQKAEMNAYLMEYLGTMQERVCGFDYRICELERKVKGEQ